MGKEFALGIDLGGTNIALGIFNRSGELFARHACSTGHKKTADSVLENIVAGIESFFKEQTCKQEDIIGIAVGTPGFLNRKSGIIYLAPNLNWRNYPLKDELEQRTRCPVFIENDANAAIYGEFARGCAREYTSAVGFTLGTGIGGGIIIDGRIVHGCHDLAGELGHITIDPDGPVCGCKNRGCLEAFASATGIKNYLVEQYSHNNTSLVYAFVNHDLDKLNPQIVHQAALQKDGFAIHVLERTGKYLGIAAANVMNIFNPPIVFFNGGMIHAGSYIMDPLIKEAQHRTIDATFDKTIIQYGILGSDAGLIGIGALAVETFFS